MYTNRSSGERGFRVVLFGAPTVDTVGLLQRLHASVPEQGRGKIITARGPAGATVFTDCAPAAVPATDGFVSRLFLYAIDGAPNDGELDRLVSTADLLVFVGDSSPAGPELDGVWRAALADASERTSRGASTLVTLDVRDDDHDGAALLVRAGAALAEGVAEGRITEWQETPERRKAGLEMQARARLLGHLSTFWGDPVEEYQPAHAVVGRPGFIVAEFPPTETRAFWTYATVGLSLWAQEAGGADPRIELTMRFPQRARACVEILMIFAREVHLRTTEHGAYERFHALCLPASVAAPAHDFFLSPSREEPALHAFPNLDARPEDVRFTYAITGTTDQSVTIGFLDVVPASPEEITLAQKLGAKAVLERRRGPAA